MDQTVGIPYAFVFWMCMTLIRWGHMLLPELSGHSPLKTFCLLIGLRIKVNRCLKWKGSQQWRLRVFRHKRVKKKWRERAAIGDQKQHKMSLPASYEEDWKPGGFLFHTARCDEKSPAPGSLGRTLLEEFSVSQFYFLPYSSSLEPFYWLRGGGQQPISAECSAPWL